MDSNTSLKKPEWLTDEEIARFKKMIADCPKPMTEYEFKHLDWDCDGSMDIDRINAYKAKKILTKYGIIS